MHFRLGESRLGCRHFFVVGCQKTPPKALKVSGVFHATIRFPETTPQQIQQPLSKRALPQAASAWALTIREAFELRAPERFSFPPIVNEQWKSAATRHHAAEQ
jgi:hypothetical protein